MNSTLQRGAILSLLILGSTLPACARHKAAASSPSPVSSPAALPAAIGQIISVEQEKLGPLPQFRGEIAQFYARLGNQPAWLRDGHLTSQGRALIVLFDLAGQKGLRPGDYGNWPALLRQLDAAKTPDQRMRIDVALTAAAMRYVSDLHFGRIRPQAMGFALGEREKHFSLADFLATRVVHAQDMERAIEGAEPPFPGYWRTLTALHRLEAVPPERKRKPLPVPRKSVHPGQPYAALPQLFHRLKRTGDLPLKAPPPADATLYQGRIVEAVERFQQRHGLVVDGILGRATVGALNVPLSHRIEQLKLTLERWRWVPQSLALPVIVVNIPEFRFYVIGRDYRWLMVQRVIIGRAYRHKTPVFIARMRSIVFRPYWKVPYSIQRGELVPHIARDPGYLRRNQYQIVTLANGPVRGPVTASVLAKLRSGALKIRQLPGGKNSLGLIKFEFPNRYDVYMHGTPATQLFSRTRRDFSHGCIRMQDPAALAAWLLRDVPGWTPEKIQATMHGTETVTVDLPHPVTVVILYGTAVVAPYGEVRFLPDIYGYDRKLQAGLARPRPKITAGL